MATGLVLAFPDDHQLCSRRKPVGNLVGQLTIEIRVERAVAEGIGQCNRDRWLSREDPALSTFYHHAERLVIGRANVQSSRRQQVRRITPPAQRWLGNAIPNQDPRQERASSSRFPFDIR